MNLCPTEVVGSCIPVPVSPTAAAIDAGRKDGEQRASSDSTNMRFHVSLLRLL
jgi:hypothetical protein